MGRLSELLAALSDLDPYIPFVFGGEESVATADGYNELAFAGFAQVYL